MLSAEAYLGGAAAALGVLVAIAWGAASVRRSWLPDWDGAPARLAEVVLALAAVVGTGRLAGALTVLHPAPTAAIGVGAAAVLAAIGHAGGRRRGRVPAQQDRHPGFPRYELTAVAGAVGLLTVQWVAHVADAYGRGMVHADTLWYHQPFAARFLQVGGFHGIEALGAPETQWYPFDAQLLHALAALPFGRDVLSPVVNLGWGALALLSAWCLGLRCRAAPAAVVAAAVVLGLPAVTATQPGQASNDVACAALLLAAAALLLEGRFATAPTAVAGIAVGLALGTKVTVAVPAAVLVVGTVALALAARRWRAAAAWALAVVGVGGFWFLRNWAGAGSPLPWFDFDVGPLSFEATAGGSRPSLSESLGDGDAWRDLYVPGLWQGLGRVWPVIFAVAIAGAVLALRSSRPGVERLLGGVVLAGLVGHVVTPLSGGYSFVFNLRFLVPILLLGFVLFARATGGWSRRSRAAAIGGLLVLVAIDATSPNRERIAAWPEGHVVAAVLVVAAGAAAVAAAWRARRALTVAGGGPRLLVPALLVTVVLAGGWPVQRAYLRDRYLDAGLFLDPVNRYFADVRDARVAVFGTDETLPMFGLDLSNEVRRGLERGRIGSDHCWAWRTTLRGRFDYIVLTHFGFGHYVAPSPWVIADDAAASEVVTDGETRVYRLSGALDPHACPTGWDWLPQRHRRT